MAERRELLIDAFNVMFADPRFGPLVRRNAEKAREEFLAWVNQNRPSDSTRVYVVFDAHRDPGPAAGTGKQGSAYQGAVHVIFARETADVWIQKRIRQHSQPQEITVVTSDRAILSTVHAYKAQHLRVSDFLHLPDSRRKKRQARHTADDKPERPTKREIEEWRKIFEDRPDED